MRSADKWRRAIRDVVRVVGAGRPLAGWRGSESPVGTGKSTGSDPVDTWNPVLLPRSIYPLLLLLRVSAGIVGGYF